MITKEQILQSEGDELSRLAGEALQSKKCFIEAQTARKHQHKLPAKYFCNTCNLWTDTPKKHAKADPIPLTPSNAFKWRDWAIEKYGSCKFEGAMVKMIYPTIDLSDETAERARVMTISALSFFAKRAQPKHYIKAACLCEIEGKL